MKLEEARELRQGRRLVTTNGVFDLLHAGHVASLTAAREMGDLLIVGLNSDDSVRRLGKGPERPLNNQADRQTVLEALRAVDGAVIFEEDTPLELLRALRPDVHVKGGDYDPATMPETPLMESWGGIVRVIPLLEGRSTTGLVKKLGCR